MSAHSVAESFFGHIEAGGLDEIHDMVTPDATVSLVPLNLAGRMAAEGAHYLRELARSFPDLVVRVRRLFVTADNTAVAEITIEGTQADDFLGVDNQEKQFDLDQAWMLRVTPDDRISAVIAYWDQNQLYRRLGVKQLDKVTITADEVAMSAEVLSVGTRTAPGENTAEATVRAFFDAYCTHNVERMVDLCADNADFRYVPFEVWTRQRVVYGEGKVCTVGKAIWTTLIDAFPDLTNTVTSLSGDSDGNVAAEVSIGGTQAKDFGTIACTGGHYDLLHLFLFHVTGDGLIDDIVAYWDNADWKKQLGCLEVD